jgi:1-deoxy-D-xylulose-5-phosphate synthase
MRLLQGSSMSEYLDKIKSPTDVKRLSLVELERLAEEIRERLITSVAKTGGHIGPNLGVVELTIAMHYVFDTPRDSFVFDVSHQSYVHKLLTGRESQFETIRQPGGLNGFMLRTESEHDSFGAGHAGTALSAALGMAVARDMSGGTEHIVALAGDAAFTNGISFEALNNMASTKRMIIVLNDNEWSIDKNVGAIAEYFHKIATNPTYVSLHDRAAELVEKFGGKAARHIARKAEEAAKGIVGRGMIFEEFGLNYYGPVDGHNLPMLIETFKFLKKQNKPVVLHALTQKGKGFQPAIDKQKKFHGLGPYDPETGETKPTGQKTYSEIFAESLTKSLRLRRRCRMGRRWICFGRIIRSGTSMWGLPRNMQCCLLRAWRRRGIGHSAQSIRRSCRGRLIRSCMMWRFRIFRSCSAWTAAG